jgi:hypothetical protein
VKDRGLFRGVVCGVVAAVALSVGLEPAVSKPVATKPSKKTSKPKSTKPRAITTQPGVVVPTTSAKVPFRLVNMCDVFNRLDLSGVLPPGRFDHVYFERSSNAEDAWKLPEVQTAQLTSPWRDSVCLLPHQSAGLKTEDLGVGQFKNGGNGRPWLGARPYEVTVAGVPHKVFRENPPGNAALSTCWLFVVLPFGVFKTQVSYNRKSETPAQVDCGPAEELLRRMLVLLESGPLVYIDN